MLIRGVLSTNIKGIEGCIRSIDSSCPIKQRKNTQKEKKSMCSYMIEIYIKQTELNITNIILYR